jgi:predicted alpha/beta superfamily hydrolase
LQSIRGRIRFDRPILSGHSFGGVTTVKALLAR